MGWIKSKRLSAFLWFMVAIVPPQAWASTSFAQGLGYNVPPVTVPFVSSVNGQSGSISIPSNFVPNFTVQSPGIVANLLSTAPCSSTWLGYYGVVSDLYSGASSTNEVMRCSSSGSAFYWRPQRTDFAFNSTSTGGAASLTCLVSAPTIFMTGALLSNLTVTLNSTNCWPGAQFDIASNVSLGIFGVTVAGLIGSTTKILGLNAHYTFKFDGTNWQYF